MIISVGELNDNKNHEIIIRAIARIPKVKYVIVGKGNLETHLLELTAELNVSDRVILTGYRTDIKELLIASDCFAFPSKREGLGIAALEGMSVGLPVIGHDIGGIRDFIVAGLTGILCDDNVLSYEGAIQKVFESSQFKLHENCHTMAEKFDCSITDNIMRSVYWSL